MEKINPESILFWPIKIYSKLVSLEWNLKYISKDHL